MSFSTNQLERWQWRMLTLLVYALPLFRGLSNVSWGLLLSLGLIGRFVGNQPPPRGGRMWTASLAWLMAGGWATLWAIEPDESWKGLWDMLRSVSLIWLMADLLPNESRRIALLRHVVLSTVLACCIVGAQHTATVMAYNEHIRDSRSLQLRAVGHFNQSAIYLAMAWVVTLAANLDRRIFPRHRNASPQQLNRCVVRMESLWIRRTGPAFHQPAPIIARSLAIGWFLNRYCLRHYWVGRSAVVIVGVSLLATTGRFPAVVAALVGGLMAWRFRFPRWVVQFGLLGLVVVALAFAGSSFIRNRVFFRGSLSNRTLIWRSATKAAQARPWTGVGLNNFKNISLETNDAYRVATVDHAHNLYLNVLSQMGIPGCMALLFLLCQSAGMIWRWRPSRGCGELGFWAAGGVWLTIFLTGLSNTSLHHQMSMLFFIVLGVVASRPEPANPRNILPKDPC